MTTFRARMMAAFAFIVVTFLVLITYTIRVAPKMGRDSKLALDGFYENCRARDYRSARAAFATHLQESISEAQLRTEWTKFAARHGAFSRVASTESVTITGFSGSVCVFPPFVDFHHAAFGTKGTGTLIQVRMVPENGKWKLERFNVLR